MIRNASADDVGVTSADSHLTDFAKYLMQEFDSRKKRNRRYSLRAFARDIGLDQSFVSKILRGQKKLSKAMIISISNKLGMSADQVNPYVLSNEKGSSEYALVDDQYYEMLSDWVSFALLELLKIQDGELKTPQYFAERLGVDLTRIERALNRLVEYQYLDVQPSDETLINYQLLKPHTVPQNHLATSEARRKLQQQFLKLSYDAVDNIDLGSRAHMGLTVAISRKNFEEARKKLVKFYMEFGQLVQKTEGDPDLDSVYQLSLSFFPLTVVPSSDSNNKQGLKG